MIQREVLTDAWAEENSKGKGITCVPLVRKLCHTAKPPERWSFQTQCLWPSKSAQCAVQKSSLRGSVLDTVSTARWFLIENNKPNVLHMRGNSKLHQTCHWWMGPRVALGTVLPWSSLLSPSLPARCPWAAVGLGICVPSLSRPHPALFYCWP